MALDKLVQHCSILVRGLLPHFRTTAIGLWQLTRGDLVLCIQESALLRSRLFQANLITPPPISASTDSHRLRDRRAPRRVFQILANSPARKTLFSWPNENYDPDEFGKLASNVRIDSPVHSTTASPASSTSGGVPRRSGPPRSSHICQTSTITSADSTIQTVHMRKFAQAVLGGINRSRHYNPAASRMRSRASSSRMEA